MPQLQPSLQMILVLPIPGMAIMSLFQKIVYNHLATLALFLRGCYGSYYDYLATMSLFQVLVMLMFSSCNPTYPSIHHRTNSPIWKPTHIQCLPLKPHLGVGGQPRYTIKKTLF